MVLITLIGYFVFHSLFDSSYKRTSASSDHGSNDSFGVDILDDEDDFDTVFLNDAHPNSSEQQDILADDDVMNEIMMAISEVNKEDRQLTLESNASGHVSSPTSQSFASPFVARTFNNLMKVKSMNVKSPTRKNGYQNINNDDDQDFGGFNDAGGGSSIVGSDMPSHGGGIELRDSDFSQISKKEDDEFFAAIDGFSLDRPDTRDSSNNNTSTGNSNSINSTSNIADTSSPNKSHNPFDMSLHNDDFAV